MDIFKKFREMESLEKEIYSYFNIQYSDGVLKIEDHAYWLTYNLCLYIIDESLDDIADCLNDGNYYKLAYGDERKVRKKDNFTIIGCFSNTFSPEHDIILDNSLEITAANCPQHYDKIMKVLREEYDKDYE